MSHNIDEYFPLRRSINESSWVIRFNYMDNLLPGEHTDLWVGRTDLLNYSHWQRSESYYPSDAPDAATAAQRHVLLGDSSSFAPTTTQARCHKFFINLKAQIEVVPCHGFLAPCKWFTV